MKPIGSSVALYHKALVGLMSFGSIVSAVRFPSLAHNTALSFARFCSFKSFRMLPRHTLGRHDMLSCLAIYVR